MIERAQRHPAGTFALCPSCRHEPMHVIVYGGSSREGPLTFSGRPCTRHQLVCACRRSTALQPSLEAAEREWGARLEQLGLALPAAPTKRRRAA